MANNVAQLILDTRKNPPVWRAVWAGKIIASSTSKEYVIRKVKIERCNKAVQYGIVDLVEPGGGVVSVVENAVQSAVTKELQQQVDKFGINDRFDFMEDFVSMIADRTSPSLLVTGEGGLGKTFTVNKALKANKLKMLDLEEIEVGATIDDKKFYTVVKGYSTAKGLYRTLFENRNRIVVFDDCDTVLRDPVALNLLKGALDSYDKRIISWMAESFGDDDLPRSFEFKGGVIFISNLPIFKIDQAVRSRCISIDLSMNTQQKIDRMEAIIKSPDFLPDYSMKVKREALDFLEKMQSHARELSLRTLISVTKVAARGGDWKNRAEYLLTAG
jgi:hypothetical protein